MKHDITHKTTTSAMLSHHLSNSRSVYLEFPSDATPWLIEYDTATTWPLLMTPTAIATTPGEFITDAGYSGS